MLTQFDMVLHEGSLSLLPQGQSRASHYILICVIIVYQSIQIGIMAASSPSSETFTVI